MVAENCCNSSSRVSDALSGLYRHCTHVKLTNTFRQNTHSCQIRIKLKKREGEGEREGRGEGVGREEGRGREGESTSPCLLHKIPEFPVTSFFPPNE